MTAPTEDRTMAMPMERTEHGCFPVTVRAVSDLAPSLRRLTLTAPELADYRPLGPDEFFGLVMPRAGSSLPDLSAVDGANPRPVLAAMPEQERPEVRWYTVRQHRPVVGELDVDVVMHGHGAGKAADGPGHRWVGAARPGDIAAFQTGTGCYRVDATGAGEQLLIGDETAYPALAAILEHLAAHQPGVTAQVILEVPSAMDLPPLPALVRGGVTVVERGDEAPGSAMLTALRDTPLPALSYAWICGEQAGVTAARRHLVQERSMAREQIYFCPYWILGRARG